MGEYDEQIELAIKIYKDKIWLPVLCDECGTTKNVKYDCETSNYYCEECLEEALRDDLQGLFDCVGKDVAFRMRKLKEIGGSE